MQTILFVNQDVGQDLRQGKEQPSRDGVTFPLLPYNTLIDGGGLGFNVSSLAKS